MDYRKKYAWTVDYKLKIYYIFKIYQVSKTNENFDVINRSGVKGNINMMIIINKFLLLCLDKIRIYKYFDFMNYSQNIFENLHILPHRPQLIHILITTKVGNRKPNFLFIMFSILPYFLNIANLVRTFASQDSDFFPCLLLRRIDPDLFSSII